MSEDEFRKLIYAHWLRVYKWDYECAKTARAHDVEWTADAETPAEFDLTDSVSPRGWVS